MKAILMGLLNSKRIREAALSALIGAGIIAAAGAAGVAPEVLKENICGSSPVVPLVTPAEPAK